MKLSVLLLTLITVSAAKTEEELLKRAAAQLERLSSFRRTREELETHLQKVPKSKEVFENAKIAASQEVLQSEQKGDKEKITKPNQRILINANAMRRIDELATTAYKLFNDPHYEAMVQERIKRSGSGDFVSGIAGKVINGVVGVTGGLSSGLSGGSGSLSGGSSGPQTHDSYGAPVPPYGEKPFSIWDFKKAILNTLIQALKALAGGAIAFKGHLIKGGGFLVQTTGRVISSAGDATSSLGTQLASSAIISAPKPAYDSSGYSYNSPHSQDYSYDGPPPSPDAGYSEQDYQQGQELASDDNAEKEAGLLIIKPMENVEVHHHDHYHHVEDPCHHQDQTNPSDHQSGVINFGGNQLSHSPGTNPITKLVGLVTGTSVPFQTHQSNQHTEYLPVEHKDQPNSDFPNDSPHVLNQPPLTNYNKYNYHQQNEQHISPSIENNNLQQSTLSHSDQLAYQEIQALLNPHLGLPINSVQSFKDQALNYGTGGSLEPLKIPILDHQNAFDSSNLVSGLPIGYGIPMDNGFETINNYYNNWKRSMMIPQIRRKNMKRSSMRNFINYRNKYPSLYRKH